MHIADSSIRIPTPDSYRFDASLDYLSRSSDERLHRVVDNGVHKLVKSADRRLVIRVEADESNELTVTCLNGRFRSNDKDFITSYAREWLGLRPDISGFYTKLASDPVIAPLLKAYAGMRLVGIVDLFEAICWSIIGQQINLKFAYQVKRRLVEAVGHALLIDDQRYYAFPTPESVLSISPENLREMKFSKQKIRYLQLAAEKMSSGDWAKKSLQLLPTDKLLDELQTLTGIGEWSANYIALRCFHRYDAIPLGDAGLHQALRKSLGLNRKPNQEELAAWKTKWQPWGGLATYYLWKSLSA